jgi:hypothetical protein
MSMHAVGADGAVLQLVRANLTGWFNASTHIMLV